jgi:heat shock protein HslJ
MQDQYGMGQAGLASSGKSDSQSSQKQTASGSQSATGSTTSGTQAGKSGTGSGTQSASGTSAASKSQAGTGGTASGTQPAATASTGANYITSISEKTWKLTELRFSDRTVVLNRGELSADQADFFTMMVDNERVSGKAAPNRYFGPYQAGAGGGLTIQPVGSTMMAAIYTDPQRITEAQYFQYLSKVKSWKVNQNKLELTGTDAANKPLTMVFSN